MSSQTARALELIHPDTRLIELRPIIGGRWWTGIFDDRQKLLSVAGSLNDLGATAVYWSVNPILPRPATNRIDPATKGACVSNKHIERVKWLFLDIDPKASGGDGREAAFALAERVKGWLGGKGWAKPIHIDSGNGCYLLYPTDLPATESKLIRNTVKALRERFDTEGAIIDPKCVNPARIARVPGTYNRKPDKPTRLCRVMEEEVANG